jgi:hypothetical protein
MKLHPTLVSLTIFSYYEKATVVSSGSPLPAFIAGTNTFPRPRHRNKLQSFILVEDGLFEQSKMSPNSSAELVETRSYREFMLLSATVAGQPFQLFVFEMSKVAIHFNLQLFSL